MSDRKSVIFPILLITLGVGWLLTTLSVIPGIDWVWTLGLAVVGLLVLVVGGVNKLSVVAGPFLLIASGLSVLRQTGRLHVDIEVPVLVIVTGLLWLVARHRSIPAPGFLQEDSRAAG